MTSCPPPVHNFDEIPQVHSLDEFWHRKYVEDEKTGTLVPAQAGAAPRRTTRVTQEAGHGDPSAQPLVLAARLGGRACRSSAYGVLYSWWLVGAGALVGLVGFYGWAIEPSVAED